MLPEELFDNIDLSGRDGIVLQNPEPCDVCGRTLPPAIKSPNVTRCMGCNSFSRATHGRNRFQGILYVDAKSAKAWSPKKDRVWSGGKDLNTYIGADFLKRSFEFYYHLRNSEPHLFIIKTNPNTSIELSEMRVNVDPDLMIFSGGRDPVVQMRDTQVLSRSELARTHNQPIDPSTHEGRFRAVMAGTRKAWAL